MPFFLEEFLALMTGKSSQELQKKRALRKLVKTINASRFRRFYRPRFRELSAQAAKFFFDIYRVISPAQLVWKGVSSSAAWKIQVIRHFVAPEILAMLDGLSEETLAGRMMLGNTKEVVRSARDDFQAFTRALGRQTAELVDNCCFLAQAFEQFVTFDYWFLLKKFGALFREHAVSGNPVFSGVKGSAVSGEIKDFLYVSLAIDQKDDWNSLFGIFRNWTNSDSVRLDQWMRVLGQVQDVNTARIFEYIVRHVDDAPEWASKSFQQREPVLNPWVETKRRELEAVLDRLSREQMNTKVGELALQAFGGQPEHILLNYTATAGETFTARGFNGFIHAEALNCLASFIALFDRDIRELCELLMIRAVYATASRPESLMDQSLLLLNLAKEIAAFDESLRADGARGYRIYQNVGKAAGNRLLIRSIQDSLDLLNDEARTMLISGSQSLAVIQNVMAAVKNDSSRDPPQMILNWPLLEQAAARPLGPWLDGAVRKLTPFVAMMSLFVQNAGGAQEGLASLD